MTNTEFTTRRTLEQKTIGFLGLWGLLVWFAVAVLIRLTGHVLLSPENSLLVVGFFLSVVPLMALVTYPVYRWFEIGYANREAAAAVMSIPGMFLDVLLILFADSVFPLMEQGAVVNFGAILLFGYGIVLLTGIIPRGQASVESN